MGKKQGGFLVARFMMGICLMVGYIEGMLVKGKFSNYRFLRIKELFPRGNNKILRKLSHLFN